MPSAMSVPSATSVPSWPQTQAAAPNTVGTGFASPSCPLTSLTGDIPKLSISQGHSKKSLS